MPSEIGSIASEALSKYTRRSSGSIWDVEPMPVDRWMTDSKGLRAFSPSEEQLIALQLAERILDPKEFDDLGWKNPVGKDCSVIVLQWGKGCILSDTVIYDADTGMPHTVGELVENGESITVTSWGGNGFVPKKASVPWKRGTGECFRVTCSDGSTIDVFGAHKFLVKSGRKWVWSRLCDVPVGTRVMVQTRSFAPAEKTVDDCWPFMIGCLLGDGVVQDTSVYLVASNQELVDRYSDCLRSVGLTPSVRVHSGWGSRTCKIVGNIRTRRYNPLYSYLRELGIMDCNAFTKKVPTKFFALTESQIWDFLSGLWATDGWIYDGRIPDIGYCSASKELVKGIRELLLRVGIYSKLLRKTVSYKGERRTYWKVQFSERAACVRFCEHVDVPGKMGAVESILKHFDPAPVKLARSTEIVSVESLGVQDYYDLEVEGTHNYCAGGLVNHNSGKDAICMAILARVAYLLQCMKDPQGYYHMARHTNIEMLNVAYSATQALNVFFNPFKELLAQAPCFRDKYEPYARSVEFEGGIVAYSGHSDQEAAEGKNLIVAILDEISAFRTINEISRGAKSPRESQHSARGIFNTLRTSAYSRFGEYSKTIALSYPRFKGDAIQTLTKDWIDDPHGYATKRATWEVRPDKTREDFAPEFEKDYERADAMYACNPPDAESPFFRDTAAIERCFSRIVRPPVDTLGYWSPDFYFDSDKPCAAHIDAAYSNDRPAVAISHVESWIEVDSTDSEVGRIPVVVNDITVSFDKFPGEKEFKLSRIRTFLAEAMRRGCNLQLVTADQFQCLTGDTLVPTSRGIVPLREVKVGDTVSSISGPNKVKNKWEFGRQPTLKVMTRNGNLIEGTSIHRILAAKPQDRETRVPDWDWYTLGELEVGDWVKIVDSPAVLPVEKNSLPPLDNSTSRNGFRGWKSPKYMTPELAEFFGVVWGDGYLHSRGCCIVCTASELDDVQDVIRRAFGCRSRAVHPNKNGTYRVSVEFSGFREWIDLLGMKKYEFPKVILESSWDCRLAFLRGLFSTDGTVDKNDGSCSLSSKSLSLVETAQIVLLVDAGVRSNISVVVRGRPGDFVDSGYQYILKCKGSRKAFLDAVGFCYSDKERRAMAFYEVPGRTSYSRIASISESSAEVYDLEIENDPSYVANGFVSHNSADTLQQISSWGVTTKRRSVDRDTVCYDTLKELIYDNRLIGYHNEHLIGELRALQLIAGLKVDHPPNGSKDEADALAGSVTGAIEVGFTTRVSTFYDDVSIGIWGD